MKERGRWIEKDSVERERDRDRERERERESEHMKACTACMGYTYATAPVKGVF